MNTTPKIRYTTSQCFVYAGKVHYDGRWGQDDAWQKPHGNPSLFLVPKVHTISGRKQKENICPKTLELFIHMIKSALIHHFNLKQVHHMIVAS